MSLPDTAYLVAISQLPGVGPSALRRLSETFGSGQKIWAHSVGEWIEQAGFRLPGGLDQTSFAQARQAIDPAACWQSLQDKKIRVLLPSAADYPALLRETHNPPLLYARGEGDFPSAPALAVVGTRKMTGYGRQIVDHLVPSLVGAGLSIVSGLALGVDAHAHRVTLTSGGQAIAVLGSGLDKIYPRTNQQLADDILDKGGWLLSEFPPGTPAQPANFPRRNRIVSGLSLGTLVVEAAAQSGALITAQFALEQNREVFAVPGSIFGGQSAGANQLISQGARLVSSVEDVLQELQLSSALEHQQAAQALPSDPLEIALLDQLRDEPLSVDGLIQRTGHPIGIIMPVLTRLELKGMIVGLGEGKFGSTR